MTLSPLDLNFDIWRSIDGLFTAPSASTASKFSPTPLQRSIYAPVACLLGCFLNNAAVVAARIFHRYALVVSLTAAGRTAISSREPAYLDIRRT